MIGLLCGLRLTVYGLGQNMELVELRNFPNDTYFDKQWG